jgi:asparagine synthase (glutamine-hydrolysing)
VLQRNDLGTFNKATLGGWRIDMRDPTADRRLVEFCLSVPTGQFMRDGVQRALPRRALADRLPQAVIDQRLRGYQAADWHVALTAIRDDLGTEIGRLEACGPAARALDLPRLRRLLAEWPTSGWERDEIMQPYRLALLRGLAAGHFLRRASGANR